MRVTLITTNSGDLITAENGDLIIIEDLFAEIKRTLTVLARVGDFAVLPRSVAFEVLPRKTDFEIKG